jgi:hypothetical protein
MPRMKLAKWLAGETVVTQRTPIPPVSKKRKARMAEQAKERKARGETTRHPGPCQVTKHLAGVAAWEKWRADYLAGRPFSEDEFHRNHVWGQKATCDEPWNVVVMSEAAHEFEDKCWQQAGIVVCMVALLRWDRLEPHTVRERIGVHPLGQLHNWLETDGLFDDEPILARHAVFLLEMTGRRCPYCGSEPEKAESRDFGTGEDFGPVMVCRPCDARVGCRKSTGEPLGRLADAELRGLRREAHAAFDPIWGGDKERDKEMRTRAYRWLSARMGLPPGLTHFARFDAEQCRKAIRFCEAETRCELDVTAYPEVTP